MYTYFQIQNFRGLEDVRLNDLARVNLIAGKNNVGKTSWLEAFFVFMNPTSLELPLRTNVIRGFRRVRVGHESELANILSPIFFNFDMERGFTLEGGYKNKPKSSKNLTVFRFTEKLAPQSAREKVATVFEANDDRALSASDNVRRLPLQITDIDDNVTTAWLLLQSDGTLQTKPATDSRKPTYFFASNVRESPEALAERHTKLINNGREDLLLASLQIIDNRIKLIRQTFQNGEPVISVDIGMKQLMPINFLGDGTFRLLQFMLAIANAENGVVLIDEIENGFHHSVHTDIWKAIYEAAKLFNAQIFATTHSGEMITAAQKAFQDMGEDAFRYYRLDREENGNIHSVKYPPETMSAAVDMNYEVRG